MTRANWIRSMSNEQLAQWMLANQCVIINSMFIEAGVEKVADPLDEDALQEWVEYLQGQVGGEKDDAGAGQSKTTVYVPFYDQREVYENCTVEILRNSTTGEVSVGWWENKEFEDDLK